MATHSTPTGAPMVSLTGSTWNVSYAATTAAATTDRMIKEGLAFGSFHVPNVSSITSVTWYAAPDKSTTPVALKDEDGVPVTQTVAADEVHQIPSAVAGCRVVACVTDAAGTLTFHWER